MQRKTALLIALTLSTVGAKSTSLRSLMNGSGGQMTINSNIFMVTKRTTAGNYLTLGVGNAVTSSGKVGTLNVLAFREYLTPAERDLFNTNVIRVALTCFNLLPERAPAITAWLDRQSQSTFRKVASGFGPMTLIFERDLLESGDFYTGVVLTRSGEPGVSPWKNYCTP
ncbi:hypothetical protein [Deinococcus alpinitundrae]|uniref:hypothetical protein n=1 Tax=Deinococcus alpinitundrae TaxID=468913 RepID=UPI00137A619E|nr:hypothetical protein [Deinococcus alpinitundrae]